MSGYKIFKKCDDEIIFKLDPKKMKSVDLFLLIIKVWLFLHTLLRLDSSETANRHTSLNHEFWCKSCNILEITPSHEKSCRLTSSDSAPFFFQTSLIACKQEGSSAFHIHIIFVGQSFDDECMHSALINLMSSFDADASDFIEARYAKFPLRPVGRFFWF